MSINPRGSSWEVSLYFPGKPRIRKLLKTENEAIIFESEARAAHARGQPVAPPPTRSSVGSTRTLRQLLNAVFESHWKLAKSADKYLLNIGHIETILGPDMPITDIHIGTIDTLISGLGEKYHNAASTMNRKLSLLRYALKFAADRDWIKSVPKMKHFKERASRIRFLTPEEEQRVLAWFTHMGMDEMHDLVIVLVDTGLRVSEALSIKPLDVDYRTNLISVWENKADHPRSIPMTRRVGAVMRARATPMGFFELNRYQADAKWDRMRASIGLSADDQFVIHALRHTCASRLVQRGVPLKVVQEWLGHKTISTTLRYSHLAPANLQAALAVLESPIRDEQSRYDTKPQPVSNVS